MQENTTAPNVAWAFLDNVSKLHGLLQQIICNRDTKVTGEFWMALCKQLKIKRGKSTAYHPQRDGQTEQVNQVLKAYLRNFVLYDQDD